MAYLKLYYHIVWRTKESVKTITELHEEDLYRYVWGIVNSLGGKLYRINSMPDHVHMFVEIPPTLSVSDFVKKVKLSSNHFMSEHREWFPLFSGWARSYCAISYSITDKDTVIRYIAGQKEHHKRLSFYDEFQSILKEAGVDFDPRYLFRE